MCYLKATKSLKIIYTGDKSSGNLTINSYSNFDWAEDYATKKSISVFIFILNSGLVS